jgi:hypothetical protein
MEPCHVTEFTALLGVGVTLVTRFLRPKSWLNVNRCLMFQVLRCPSLRVTNFNSELDVTDTLLFREASYADLLPLYRFLAPNLVLVGGVACPIVLGVTHGID